MELRVLGPIELVGDDGSPRLLAAKQRRLLAALLVHAGQARSADALIDAVWGESPPASARKLLQIYVSQLRKALPAGPRIVTRGSGYSLELDGAALDAAQFERLLADGRAALKAENGALAASLLGRALALWRGPAYGDVAFDDFARSEIERLEELRLIALEERVEAELRLGRHADLLGEVRGLAAAHPLRERLQGQAMLALYRSGRQTEALEVYAATRARLHELGLEPGAELRELHGRILRQDEGLDLHTGSADLSLQLPSSPNELVGRKRELDELGAMVERPDVRLLVLTGAGGSGKTRLALELARRSAPSFANGAAFVELASVRDPGLVVATIARALDVADVPDKGQLESLVAALRPRELLLVVDNAEHLRLAAPAYAQLVAGVPRLTLVVTSRVVLHLSGEHVYPVEPLGDEAAVELFVQRARRAEPRFDPGSADEQAIRRICERLDGLPLAIELAASRVRTLSPSELLERLEPRLPLLTGGPRDLPARQQTLAATLRWSYELLSEDERRDLTRLAVFAGGCTLDAAEAVCGTTVGRLASLVDHNLIRRSATPQGSRYRLLETVREFALDQREGVVADYGRAHADYFLALAERAASEIPGPRETAALARLELEHDNLRASLAWMIDSGESEWALRLGSALWRFWFVRGHFLEGRLWLERALERADAPPPDLRAQALGAAARLVGQLGDLDAASAYAEQSLELYRAGDDRDGLRSALGTLAVAVSNQGQLDRAEALQLEAIEIARQLGDRHGEAINVANLGSVELLRGDNERAEARFRRSRAMFIELDEREPLWNSLFALAVLALHKRRFGEAAGHLAEGLAVCQEVGSKAGISCCLEALAALAAARNRAAEAATLLGSAQMVAESIGFQFEPFEQRLHDRTVLAVSAALGAEEFARTRDRGRQLTVDEALAWALGLTAALGSAVRARSVVPPAKSLRSGA